MQIWPGFGLGCDSPSSPHLVPAPLEPRLDVPEGLVVHQLARPQRRVGRHEGQVGHRHAGLAPREAAAHQARDGLERLVHGIKDLLLGLRLMSMDAALEILI